MGSFSQNDLSEARRSLASTMAKCEKVEPKLKPGSAQHTLLVQRIKAFRVALALVERELADRAPTD
jgi:hypothetical protein